MSEYGGGFLKTVRHPRSSISSSGFALVTESALATKTATDSLTVGLIDAYATNSLTLSISESLLAGLADAPLIYVAPTVDDTCVAGLTDTIATLAAVFATSETLTVQLTDAYTALSGIIPVSDTLSVGTTDLFTGSQSISSIDDLALGLTDVSSNLLIASASEDCATGLTDTVSQLAAVIATNDLAVIGLTDTDTVTSVTFSLSDSLAVGLTDTVASSATLSVTDVCAIGFTDEFTGSQVLAVADSLSAGLDESVIVSAAMGVGDSAVIQLTDSANASVVGEDPYADNKFQNISSFLTPRRKSLFFRYPLLTGGFVTDGSTTLSKFVQDSLAVQLAASVFVSVSAEWSVEMFQPAVFERTKPRKRYDSRLEHHKFSFGLVDARPIMPAIAQLLESTRARGKKSQRLQVLENTGWLYAAATSDVATFSVADSVQIGTAEATTNALTISIADTALTGLTDTPALTVAVSTVDTLAIGLDDIGGYNDLTGLIPVFVTDAISVQLTESTGNALSIFATDSLTITLSESSNISAAVVASDSLVVQATEATSIACAMAVADTCAVQGSEAASLLSVVMLAVVDAWSVALAEGTASIVAALTASETLVSGALDEFTGSQMFSAQDSVGIGGTDTASILAEVFAGESTAVGWSESAAWDYAGEQIIIVVAEALGLSLEDAAEIVRRAADHWVGSIPIHHGKIYPDSWQQEERDNPYKLRW